MLEESIHPKISVLIPVYNVEKYVKQLPIFRIESNHARRRGGHYCQ